MILWGSIWGIVIGMFWSASGTFIGGLFGALIGWTLRFLVRQEVSAHTETLRQALKDSLLQEIRADEKSVYDKLARFDDPLDHATTSESMHELTSQVTQQQIEVIASAEKKDFPERVDPEHLDRTYKTASVIPGIAKPDETAPGFSYTEFGSLNPATNTALSWLMGGNTVVRVGLIILFIGLSFLARYAVVSGLFPVELRLALIGFVGISLLVFGFRKRDEKPGFALALQGAGVAVMYLTSFASFRLYQLIPTGAAFGLLIMVSVCGCALALLQNALVLAIAAFAGGFLAPVLTSKGGGDHVVLFAYYAVLNLAVLYISSQRSWRILSVLGCAATFGIATAWGVLKYVPEQYVSTQPFLALFVLIYIAAVVQHARNTPAHLNDSLSSSLVFGTPIVGFGLQVGLVQHLEFGAAFSALIFSAVYVLLALWLWRCSKEKYGLLIECFTAIGVVFVTLAVPLALDVRWTSGLWALEGAGTFWVGMRQARWIPRAFGLALQAVAALMYLSEHQTVAADLAFILNSLFIGAMLVALPLFLIAWWLRQPLGHSSSKMAQMYVGFEVNVGPLVYLVGFAFWCMAWVTEIRHGLPLVLSQTNVSVVLPSWVQLTVMMALLLSAAGSLVMGVKTQWTVATWPSRLSWLLMTVTLLVQIVEQHRVLDAPAWAFWPLALAVHYWMLHKIDQTDVLQSNPRVLNWHCEIHAWGVWFLTALLADALWFWIKESDLRHTSWASVVMLIANLGMLMLLAVWAGRANQFKSLSEFSWPRNPYAQAYYWVAALPLAAATFGGAFLMAIYSSGRTEPLPYIPLLNPTDLALGLAIIVLLFWRRTVKQTQPSLQSAFWLNDQRAHLSLMALCFVSLNSVWLRVAHHFFAVPWNASDLFVSFVVQTGYAILWTFLALVLMVVAHRRAQRTMWHIGAGLQGIVVLKLLLIDLSNAGGVERIIAFIGVGILMLLVGYFAPLPPTTIDAEG